MWSQYPTVRERVINLPNFDERFVHYGYYVGLNQYDFKFEYTADYYRVNNYPDIEVLPKRGFSIGLIGDMRINKLINLRLEPGLYYNQRDLIFPDYVGVESEIERTREANPPIFTCPFILKLMRNASIILGPLFFLGSPLILTCQATTKTPTTTPPECFEQ